jgi:F-type H+-transporting ATPase subunit b
MLDISLALIVLTAIVFFALLFFLDKWLYKPLLGFMEERERTIKKDLEAAAKNESGAKEILAEAKRIVEEARHEAAARKKEAVDAAKAEAAKLIEQKKAELERRYEEFLAQLKNEEESIRSTLISQTPLFKEALKAKFNKL